MAKISYYLDQRNKRATAFPLKIRISHKGVKRYIATDYDLLPNNWDGQRINSSFKNSARANSKINNTYTIVENVIEDLSPYLDELDANRIKQICEKAIKENYDSRKKSLKDSGLLNVLNQKIDSTPDFYQYAQSVANEFYLNDQKGSASIIENMIDSIRSFTGKANIQFGEITVKFLRGYEQWFLNRTNKKGKPNSVNSLGFYTKEVRRVYNIAIKDKECSVYQNSYPFGKGNYSIKVEKKPHKNIGAGEIAKVFQLQLPRETALWHHHNYFLYYFDCNGMNFADLAYLKVYQVKNGQVQYRRRKTKYRKDIKLFTIKHSPIAQRIIEHYIKGKKDGEYVFPILENCQHLLLPVKNKFGRDKQVELENAMLFQKKFVHIRSNHIRRLKTIAKKAGVEGDLTTYIGRHSFFSIALQSGVSKSVISELAGHADFKTTEAYMAGFEQDKLNDSADLVRKAIMSKVV